VKNFYRRWQAAVPVLLLSLSGVAGISGPAAAAAPVPGTVLSATTVTLPSDLADLATIKRISYLSTNVSGGSITVTGLVITPKLNRKFKTVAWGHGTTGLADQCAPSANRAVFWPEARAAVRELLKRGWTVAAADYPGLGTPEEHPYLVGGSTARTMIDSVKAARNLDPALSTQYVLDGHSQGGQGALFAGELAPSYDGALVLKGVAAIAPVSNVDLIAPSIPGTANQGYLVMGLYGLAVVDRTFRPSSVLTTAALEKASVLQSGCLYDILAAYRNFTAAELVKNGVVPEDVVAKLGRWDNPAQSPSSAPILIVQGTADEAVPYEVTVVLVRQLRAYAQPVRAVPIEGADHEQAVFASTVLVADWITTRFAA
jgi:pimeloyl-ACP methyl ester carboxylesterase